MAKKIYLTGLKNIFLFLFVNKSVVISYKTISTQLTKIKLKVIFYHGLTLTEIKRTYIYMYMYMI